MRLLFLACVTGSFVRSNRLWMTIISLDSSHPMIRRRQRIRHLANGLRIDYLVNGAYAAPTPGI